MSQSKINQITSSINAAQAALNIAKSALKDLETEQANLTKLIPGVYGKFMGDYILGEDGQKYPVAPNYASKSMLVYGDKLKLYDENGQKRFKQVEKVKRSTVDAILAKKEGKWHAVTADGSHRVLDAAVDHFGAMEGTLVQVLIPENDKFAPFAAIEKVTGGPVNKDPKIKEVKVENLEKKEVPQSVSVESKPVEHVETIAPIKSEPSEKKHVQVDVLQKPHEDEQKKQPPVSYPKPQPVSKPQPAPVVKKPVQPMKPLAPVKKAPVPLPKQEVPVQAPKAPASESPKVLTDEDLR